MTGVLVSGPLYQVFVGNTWVGELGQASGQTPSPLQASFAVGPEIDLRGQRIEVRLFGTPTVAAIYPQSVPAGVRAYHKDLRKPKHLRLDLLNPGTDLDATGRLDWRVKKGIEQLQLDVHDLPAGSYDVVLDGSVVAAGALVVTEDGGEADVLFSNGDEPLALPLEFSVQGALEIRAAGTSTTYLLQDLGD
jgi:hypothetical protein